MNKQDLKKRIYLSLKTGPKTLDELQLDIGKRITKKEIAACMDILLKDGWIERYARHYQLKHVLGSPIDITTKDRTKDWNYERIQEVSPLPSTARPPRWMNPFLAGIPHCDQGGRGTCLPGRTNILMESYSWKPIYRVNVGDRVITHTGVPKTVTQKYVRKWQGNTYKIWVYGLDTPLEATREHPILTRDGWKEIDKITQDDYLGIPIIQEISDKTIYSFEKDPDNWCLEINGEGIGSKGRGYFDRDQYWSRVRKVEVCHGFTGGSVYNLEVEEDNSYIAETIAVHNCCGFAGKYAAWLKQLELVDPPLDQTETSKITYDVPVDVFGQCKMMVDIQHDLAPSAQGLYIKCREEEGITHPTGCWIRGIAKTWKNSGYNYEKDWQTAKLATCVPKYFPLKGTEEETRAFLDQQGKDHKIDGYAVVTSWDGLKDAIYNYGCVIIAINMYDNCTRNNKIGVLPDPDGDCIGSHALCAVGYDEDTIWFLHSWRAGWDKINGISKKYYTEACGPAYVPIDSADVGIAQEIYGVVTVSTNIDCEIWIGKDMYSGKSAKSSIELGREYEIIAVPKNPKLVQEPELRETIKATKDSPTVNVSFMFTELEDKYGWIRKFLEDILKRFGLIR